MKKFAKVYHTVLYNKKLSPYERLVLIYLGEVQGKNDASWHKQQSIADKLGIGRQHVNKCIGNLERSGFISIDRQRNTIFYTVVNSDNTNGDTVVNSDTTLSLIATPIYIEEPDQLEPDQYIMAEPVLSSSPDSLKTERKTKKEPDLAKIQAKQERLERQQAEFAEFWDAYPKGRGEKGSRLLAQNSYFKALQTTTHSEIMAGLEAYKVYLPTMDRPARNSKEEPWINRACHAVTWLNQARWANEYETATPQAEETPAERGIRLRAEFALKKQQQSA